MFSRPHFSSAMIKISMICRYFTFTSNDIHAKCQIRFSLFYFPLDSHPSSAWPWTFGARHGERWKTHHQPSHHPDVWERNVERQKLVLVKNENEKKVSDFVLFLCMIEVGMKEGEISCEELLKSWKKDRRVEREREEEKERRK